MATGRLDHAKAKRYVRARVYGQRDHTLGGPKTGHWKGVREEWDGPEFPVTVTRIPAAGAEVRR